MGVEVMHLSELWTFAIIIIMFRLNYYSSKIGPKCIM